MVFRAPTFDLGCSRSSAGSPPPPRHCCTRARLGSMSSGDVDARHRAGRPGTEMNPLDEHHHALLIRLYRIAGDELRAAKQFAACTEILDRELGIARDPPFSPPLQEVRPAEVGIADRATVEALIEAGRRRSPPAPFNRGCSRYDRGETGRHCRHRRATVSGHGCHLAEALVHSLRGFDEEGLAALYEADEISLENDFSDALRQIRAEIGYVDFLRARYDRALVRFTDPCTSTLLPHHAAPSQRPDHTYLGAVDSDQAIIPCNELLNGRSTCPAPPATSGGRPTRWRCWGGCTCSWAIWTPLHHARQVHRTGRTAALARFSAVATGSSW